MLERDDLLRNHGMTNAAIGASDGPVVAILRGPNGEDTLLRVAAYPEEGLAYCGLWFDDDLLLGGSTTALNTAGDQLFLAGSIDMLGRSFRRLSVNIIWTMTHGRRRANVLRGEAEILDERGHGCGRLVVPESVALGATDSTATVLPFTRAASGARHPSSAPRSR